MRTAVSADTAILQIFFRLQMYWVRFATDGNYYRLLSTVASSQSQQHHLQCPPTHFITTVSFFRWIRHVFPLPPFLLLSPVECKLCHLLFFRLGPKMPWLSCWAFPPAGGVPGWSPLNLLWLRMWLLGRTLPLRKPLIVSFLCWWGWRSSSCHVWVQWITRAYWPPVCFSWICIFSLSIFTSCQLHLSLSSSLHCPTGIYVMFLPNLPMILCRSLNKRKYL